MARKNQNFRRKAGRYIQRAGKVVGKAMRMRYGTWKKPKISNIVKDVSFLKSVINVEKKRVDTLPISDQTVGQVNGNSGGSLCIDLTPTISQGQTSSTRNGDSIKITGILLQGQFYGMGSHTSKTKLIMEIWMCPNRPAETINSVTLTNLFNTNPISQVIDYNSLRNPDYFANYKRIAVIRTTVAYDNFSGQIGVATFKKFIKLDHHLRYFKDGAAITDGQWFCTVRADNGNNSASTASTLPRLSVTPINTGVWCQLYQRVYYVDN